MKIVGRDFRRGSEKLLKESGLSAVLMFRSSLARPRAILLPRHERRPLRRPAIFAAALNPSQLSIGLTLQRTDVRITDVIELITPETPLQL